MIDISFKGVGLLTAERMKAGQFVVVSLTSLDFVCDLKAKVIWCKELPISKKVIKVCGSVVCEWCVGLQFELESEAEASLAKKIAEAL